MERRTLLVMSTASLALLGGLLATEAKADAGYNSTIAGNANYSPLVNLAQSSILNVDVVNLPANVGLYTLNCKVPADPRSAPTACDSSAESLAYLPADPAARASVRIPIRVNAEFYGTNPNPTAGPSVGESVDCRAVTGNPRLTTCGVYVLGAGKESANPAYLRFFPTVFTPVKATRVNDAAFVVVGGNQVAVNARRKLPINVATPLTVTLKSGLTPTVTSDNCSIAKGRSPLWWIRAPASCVLRQRAGKTSDR